MSSCITVQTSSIRIHFAYFDFSAAKYCFFFSRLVTLLHPPFPELGVHFSSRTQDSAFATQKYFVPSFNFLSCATAQDTAVFSSSRVIRLPARPEAFSP